MIATDKFIVFNAPDLGTEEMTAVLDVIRSGWIGTGKVCKQFEEEFADFMGGGYAVGVSSCTMGLQLSLQSIDIKGFSVIAPAVTFAATINAIIAAGGKPKLVDIDQSGCIDVDKANKSVDSWTRAIIPVHFSGFPVKLKRINKELRIIEDCAHAFGSLLSSNNNFKVFSFYANKNITCAEGGMVLTKDKKLSEEIRILSAQGLSLGAFQRYGKSAPRTYSVEKVGNKGNLPDILAAIGLAQLRRWPEIRQKRMAIWKIYEKAFGSMGIGHSTHFYPLKVKNRDQMRLKLHEKGIGTGIHYKPLHLEPAYSFLHQRKGDFPIAEEWGETELSLPVSPKMCESDARRVVEEVKTIQGAQA